MNKTAVTRSILTVLTASLATLGCNSEAEKTAAAASSQDSAQTSALIKRVGAPPGPVKHDEAAAAVLVRTQGEVEVRPLGEELFTEAGSEQGLYSGDQIRTAAGAQATLLFPDGSTAQLAEGTTVSVGTRVSTPDPTSSAAVLGGVTRFSAKTRVPAEGPFIVFTPAGLVTTKGATFGVGVAANGEARVGVEHGSVDVVGAATVGSRAALTAKHAVSLSASGSIGAAVDWLKDDWGTWRDGIEAGLNADTTLAAHGSAMTQLDSQLAHAHASIEALALEVSEFEIKAAADAKAEDKAAYAAKLRDAQIAMDASYLASLKLEWLTHAHAAHAALASDIHVRHPKLAAWAKVEPQVHAAVLWPKRFDVVANAYLEPLRAQYYVHHLRGRARAELVGIAVPQFYLKVTPPQVPLTAARAKLKFEAFALPELTASASERQLWAFDPKRDWHKTLEASVTPPRADVGFWVSPAEPRSKLLMGIKAEIDPEVVFGAIAPAPRAGLKLNGKADLTLGHYIRVPAPNLQAGASARAAFQGKYTVPSIEVAVAPPVLKTDIKVDLRAKAAVDAAAKAQAHVKSAHASVKAAHASVKASLDGVRAAARGGLKAKAKLKVQAPKVTIKPPKAKASAKASFKLGR